MHKHLGSNDSCKVKTLWGGGVVSISACLFLGTKEVSYLVLHEC
jgi:hypothetical protein